LDKLNLLGSEVKQLQSALIQKNLQTLLAGQSGIWAAYKNLSDEPAIDFDQVSKTITWVFPKVIDTQLSFFKASTQFSKSKLRISEPQNGEAVLLDNIKGLVIPALAYDQQGYRLGRGQGFYDRSLQNYTGQKIGVCFELSLNEQLPHEAHDVACDTIVTEKQIYKVNNSEGAKKWN
jgi:5-formyltetrahydrofolate cyclo-ligase